MIKETTCCVCNHVKKCIDLNISICYTDEQPYICKQCLEKTIKYFKLLEDTKAFI